MIYPFRCEPIYQKRVWGGRWFAESLGRRLPDGEPYGESWELSCRTEAMSRVRDGEWAGQTLLEVINRYPVELAGRRIKCESIESFPLLIKFLDATDHLSVQVHPTDDYVAPRPGQRGKTEMWYVLDAEPEARLVLGLKDGVDAHDFAEGLRNGSILAYLNDIPVKPGDAFYIPAGTVHAILKGIRLAEIQQNSDITYRIYDWGRPGLDGRPRELHLEDGLRAIDFQRGGIAPAVGVIVQEHGWRRQILVACPHFAVELLEVEMLQGQIPSDRFEVWMVLSGTGTLTAGTTEYQMNPGETWIMPAGMRDFELAGQIKFLKTYVPDVQNEIIAPLMARGFTREHLRPIGGLW